MNEDTNYVIIDKIFQVYSDSLAVLSRLYYPPYYTPLVEKSIRKIVEENVEKNVVKYSTGKGYVVNMSICNLLGVTV